MKNDRRLSHIVNYQLNFFTPYSRVKEGEENMNKRDLSHTAAVDLTVIGKKILNPCKSDKAVIIICHVITNFTQKLSIKRFFNFEESVCF